MLYFVQVYHDFVTKHRKTTIKFEKKPEGQLIEKLYFLLCCIFCDISFLLHFQGYGLRCHRIIHAVAEVLGIQDMRCKITGPTTPISVVRGTFQGLLSQVNDLRGMLFIVGGLQDDHHQ